MAEQRNQKQNPDQAFVDHARTVNISRRRMVQGASVLAALAAAGGPGFNLNAYARQATPAAAAMDIGKPSSTLAPFDSGGATLRVASWGGFWEELERKHILDDFQKDFNCQISYDSSWPWFPKFVAGGVDNPPFDVANWNLPELFKTARAGDFFVSIDELTKNVPNSANLWPFSTKNGLGITYLYSGYCYGYRTDLVNPAPTTFKEFWDPKFSGKRGTYITSNTLQMVFFQMAAKAFSGDEHNIDAGVQAMKDAMPMKISDFTGNMTALLERGEVEICVQTDGEVFAAADKGVAAAAMYWPDMNMILTQTKTVSKGSSDVQKKLAYAYVDRCCSPEFQEAMGVDVYMRPTNKDARVVPNLEAKGVVNTADAAEKMTDLDWNWYLDNEQDIVEQVNEIFGQ